MCVCMRVVAVEVGGVSYDNKTSDVIMCNIILHPPIKATCVAFICHQS